MLAQRRIKVFAAFDHVPENASLQFTQPGFYDQHGYASADPSDGSMVYGKIYLILEKDARPMDYFAGEPFLRVHEKVFRQADGIRFYYYRTTRIVDGVEFSTDCDSMGPRHRTSQRETRSKTQCNSTNPNTYRSMPSIFGTSSPRSLTNGPRQV